MSLHALQDVGDALDVTREFLLPFELRRWLKLAVVAFFLGGAGMSVPGTQFGSSSGPDQTPDTGVPSSLPDDILPVLIAVAAVVVLLWLLFGLVGAIMEFVFVESLRTGEVSIREYWSRRWRQGLRLFGFRLAISLPVLGLFLGWVALFVVPLLAGVADPIVPLGIFLLGLPVLFVIGLLYWVVATFTTVFVVPIMVLEDTGVLAGWRRLWPSIRADWKEYLAYAVVSVVLAFAAGLAASFVVGIGALAVLIPLAVLGIIAYLTLSLSSTVGLAILAVLAALFVAFVVALWALVQVPVLSYLRYYALLVLGDVEPEFDLVADQRAAVRED